MNSKESTTYKCFNDCQQTGCPGHFIELIFHHTSDTVSIREDSKDLHTYDRKQWQILMQLDQLLRER